MIGHLRRLTDRPGLRRGNVTTSFEAPRFIAYSAVCPCRGWRGSLVHGDRMVNATVTPSEDDGDLGQEAMHSPRRDKGKGRAVDQVPIPEDAEDEEDEPEADPEAEEREAKAVQEVRCDPSPSAASVTSRLADAAAMERAREEQASVSPSQCRLHLRHPSARRPQPEGIQTPLEGQDEEVGRQLRLWLLRRLVPPFSVHTDGPHTAP